jgi:hypothetical protein
VLQSEKDTLQQNMTILEQNLDSLKTKWSEAERSVGLHQSQSKSLQKRLDDKVCIHIRFICELTMCVSDFRT